MRRTIAALVALPFCVPVQAQDLFDQYQGAAAIFADGLAPEESALAYPAAVLDGLDGLWFAIGNVAPQTSDPDFFARACKQIGGRIAVLDSYTFTLSYRAGEPVAMTQTFVAIGGPRFGLHTPMQDVSARLAMTPENHPKELLAAVARFNGIASVYRPSDDMLVIQVNDRPPELFGRCAIAS